MRIEEIWDRIRIKSGQFILSRTKIELDVDSFRILVEDALAEYNKSRPFDKTYSLNIPNRHYTFSENYDEELKMIPDWLAEVTPTRSFVSSPIIGSITNNSGYSTGELIDPLQAPWDYTKPNLVVPYTGFYKVRAVFNHRVVEVTDEISGVKDWVVTTISIQEDPWFFKLLQAMFMQGIGRSRRSFTLSDMPILMDADQIYSEGQALEEKALEEIHANKKIFLTLG